MKGNQEVIPVCYDIFFLQLKVWEKTENLAADFNSENSILQPHYCSAMDSVHSIS